MKPYNNRRLRKFFCPKCGMAAVPKVQYIMLAEENAVPSLALTCNRCGYRETMTPKDEE